jgi:hypothetical protein
MPCFPERAKKKPAREPQPLLVYILEISHYGQAHKSEWVALLNCVILFH